MRAQQFLQLRTQWIPSGHATAFVGSERREPRAGAQQHIDGVVLHAWLGLHAQIRSQVFRSVFSVHIEAVPAINQRPVLQLGLIGFSRQQQADIERDLLVTGSSGVDWRVGPLQTSVAWWVNGARTQVLTDGSIRVAPGEAGGRSLRLSLADVDRPVAFAQPVACKDLEPAMTFTLTDPVGATATLREIESRWLGAAIARHWLCHRLVTCGPSLKHRVYHVLDDGELLAVVDRIGDVGIAPGASLERLEAARWVGLPSSANDIPKHFDRCSCSELIWSYAVQSSGDHLPERYRHKPILFRRPPKVAQRLLHDEHLVLMAELRREACSFEMLAFRTGMPATALSKALGELYLAGSITVSPVRAKSPPTKAASAHRDVQDAANERAWNASGHSRHWPSVIDTARLDPTVPAILHFG